MRKTVVGVTGPAGFIASHLLRLLEAEFGVEAIPCPRAAWERPDELTRFASQCQSIVHLAGCNRGDPDELYRVNCQLASALAAAAGRAAEPPHLVFASSTQRDLDNCYGRSKREGERLLAEWVAARQGRAATAVVLPNVFGPGCRPFYNSVVATFCRQLADGNACHVSEDRELELAWVVDAATELARAAVEPAQGWHVRRVRGFDGIRVSDLLERLTQFQACERRQKAVPDLADPFTARLYATYRSYLPLEEHCVQPELRADDRGCLYEAMRFAKGGQIFFSTTRPGVIRGNHYHTRKVEWFCVVRGEAAIRLRRIGDSEVREIRVSGDRPEFVSIPVLHAHQIENVGQTELLTMFWCNEVFNAADADTWQEKVA